VDDDIPAEDRKISNLFFTVYRSFMFLASYRRPEEVLNVSCICCTCNYNYCTMSRKVITVHVFLISF